MKKYYPLLTVLFSLAILAPAVILWPLVGITDLIIEILFLALVMLVLRHVGWPLKIGLVLLSALFFTFPPVPNYLWVSDKGLSLQWIGFANMLESPLPIVERLLFYGACWLVIAKLTEKKQQSN